MWEGRRDGSKEEMNPAHGNYAGTFAQIEGEVKAVDN